MIEEMKNSIPGFWDKYKYLFNEKKVRANTILLLEGDISKNIYFIKRGCLRLWFNKDGKDITFQFFFEKQAVSSIESFFNKVPSLFTLEAIEESILYTLNRTDFDTLLNEISLLKDEFLDLVIQRLQNYGKLFLSRIKDSPRERYLDLLQNNPNIIERVPQHYIASYLGITSVSLSRIKNNK